MCSHQASSSMGQTLDELEFERGLWSAACDGDLNKCKELLQRGHNPSKPDNSGFTPLHYAVRSASKELVECLLEAGSDVNAQTKAGKATALHRACSRGRPEIVELLISEYFSYLYATDFFNRNHKIFRLLDKHCSLDLFTFDSFFELLLLCNFISNHS